MTGLEMDEHIARIALNQGATPQVKTYLTDALGSVIATAKADQSLEVGYAFSPYGQTQKVGVENQLAGSENSSQYTGRENDGNGLYFYRARYYDPVLKRFISEDPIGLRGGLNVYSYVNGNPISITDPTGLIGEGGTGAGGFPGPSSCTYYEKRCTDSCGEDKYACEAKKCCEAFGDNKSSNCTRICLIQQDENTCSKLSGNSRDQCRKNAHYGCYAVCMNTKDAVDGWFGFKPPAACEGASGAIGGMW